MAGGFVGLATLMFEAVPLMIQGVEGAIDVFQAGKAIWDKAHNEGREPTDDEIESVRNIRKQHYDDFYSDDEAQG